MPLRPSWKILEMELNTEMLPKGEMQAMAQRQRHQLKKIQM